MNISHDTLMRYFDGELPPEDAAEVEAELAKNPEAVRVLEGLDQIGEVVRGVALARADAHPDLTDRILERVEAEPRASGATQGRALERLSMRPLPQKSRLQRAAPALIGGLALAAAAALLFERERTVAPTAPIVHVEQPHAPPPETVPEPRSAPPPSEPIAEVDTTPAIAIETVDFGTQRGSIFMLQEGEAATPVVWLMDEPGPGIGRVEPL